MPRERFQSGIGETPSVAVLVSLVKQWTVGRYDMIWYDMAMESAAEARMTVGSRATMTKETETSLLNCLYDIPQTAPAWDLIAVADEVITLDVEDATLIPHVEIAA